MTTTTARVDEFAIPLIDSHMSDSRSASRVKKYKVSWLQVPCADRGAGMNLLVSGSRQMDAVGAVDLKYETGAIRSVARI
jgi:hypothetical protein